MTPQEKQQIKARFFGMHIGGNFIHPDFEQPQILMGVANYKIGVTPIGSTGSCFYNDGWVDIERCKLILRHISLLSAQELATMDVMVFNGDKKSAYHKKIEYLRSINIATHFMGIDPVTEGWAELVNNQKTTT